MKLSLYIILLALILISCRGNKNNNVEEGINNSVVSVRNIQAADSAMLNYLNSRYKLLPDTLYLKQSDFIPGIESDKKCGYVLSFEEGHTYQHAQECVEWGEIVEVYLSGYTLDELRQLVNKLYPSDNYNWHENETQYRPEQYYENEWTFEIIQDKEKYILRIAYSWI